LYLPIATVIDRDSREAIDRMYELDHSGRREKGLAPPFVLLVVVAKGFQPLAQRLAHLAQSEGGRRLLGGRLACFGADQLVVQIAVVGLLHLQSLLVDAGRLVGCARRRAEWMGWWLGLVLLLHFAAVSDEGFFLLAGFVGDVGEDV